MAIRKLPICNLADRLSGRIRELRGETTLEEFCKGVGLSKSSLARVINGTQNVRLTTLQTMCDHLGCDIGYLFSPPAKVSVDRKKKKRGQRGR